MLLGCVSAAGAVVVSPPPLLPALPSGEAPNSESKSSAVATKHNERLEGSDDE